MPIYPSLEDLKGGEMIGAQLAALSSGQGQGGHGVPSAPPPGTLQPYPSLGSSGANYPSLREFMGLELSEEILRLNMPEYLEVSGVATPGGAGHGHGMSMTAYSSGAAGAGVLSPVSGIGSYSSSGSSVVSKSLVTHGVRHTRILKDNNGKKIGLRVRSLNTGIFVCLVTEGSVAAKAGLRFGDQILQIDGVDMAGLKASDVHGIFNKKTNGQAILLALRDRPFERSITLVRDSAGHIGFQFKEGVIVNIVKDSSAARNGLLTDHALLEVNGRNVIGLKDKEITKIIGDVGGVGLVITVMPHFLYKHMIKEMNSDIFRKMDHSGDI